MSYLQYANQGATRGLPLDPSLVNALSFLQDMGVTMKVFSGGQPSSGPNRTGSHRHDNGDAADVLFYKDGRQLDWRNPNDIPVFQTIVEKAKQRGVTGFGAGDNYMIPGSMHIGFGTPAVWGAKGEGANAPGWLRQAFNGVAVSPVIAKAATPPVIAKASPPPSLAAADISPVFSRATGTSDVASLPDATVPVVQAAADTATGPTGMDMNTLIQLATRRGEDIQGLPGYGPSRGALDDRMSAPLMQQASASQPAMAQLPDILKRIFGGLFA